MGDFTDKNALRGVKNKFLNFFLLIGTFVTKSLEQEQEWLSRLYNYHQKVKKNQVWIASRLKDKKRQQVGNGVARKLCNVRPISNRK